jgi:hypothetical protein
MFVLGCRPQTLNDKPQTNFNYILNLQKYLFFLNYYIYFLYMHIFLYFCTLKKKNLS